MYKKMDNKQKILELIFEDSQREYHIREIARIINVSANTVMTATDELKKEDLILKQKDDSTNRVLIKANTKNNIFILLKREYNIRKIIK